MTLAHPRVPIGVIEAHKDAWLAPGSYVEAVRMGCADCVLVADLVKGGHASAFSSMPADLLPAEAPLLADPPSLGRRTLTNAHGAVTTFLTQNLLP